MTVFAIQHLNGDVTKVKMDSDTHLLSGKNRNLDFAQKAIERLRQYPQLMPTTSVVTENELINVLGIQGNDDPFLCNYKMLCEAQARYEEAYLADHKGIEVTQEMIDVQYLETIENRYAKPYLKTIARQDTKISWHQRLTLKIRKLFNQNS